MYGWKDRLINEWMNTWMDGRVDEWMDVSIGWMDGWLLG